MIFTQAFQMKAGLGGAVQILGMSGRLSQFAASLAESLAQPLPEGEAMLHRLTGMGLTAEQFAENCNSDLDKIITATQGQFSIENRDNNSPHIKKIRVVSTITYSLKD